MENLDEFMRHKFNSEEQPGGQFEFREEFWEQALALIELDEARRAKRRRRIAFWALSALILLVGVWGMLQTGRELFRKPATVNAASEAVAGTENNATKNTGAQSPDLADLQQVASPTMPPASLGSTASGQNAYSAGQLPASTPATNSIHSSNSILSTKLSTENKVVATSPSATASDSQTSSVQNSGAEHVDAVALRNAADQLGRDANGTDNFEKPGATANAGLPENNNAVVQQAKRMENLPMLGQKGPQSLGYTRVLSLPTMYASWASSQPFIQPLKGAEPGLRITLEEFVCAYAPAVYGIGKRGVGGGIALERHLRGNWSATAGLIYRHLPNTASAPVTAENTASLRFSFGSQAIEKKKVVTGYHVFELPLGIQYQLGRLALNVHASPALTVGASGYEEQSYQSYSLIAYGDFGTTQKNDSYFTADAYRRFNLAFGAGLEYRVYRAINLSVQYQYYINGMVINPENAVTDNAFAGIQTGIKIRI